MSVLGEHNVRFSKIKLKVIIDIYGRITREAAISIQSACAFNVLTIGWRKGFPKLVCFALLHWHE
ncbi:hypothetical protein B5D82_14190 [Cognaticolwellia beringensis]|uniref:Uncharacterized protein n=1 Tax=Cognaticolwellia beringensis TaxID=1967665 RepID=A0A222GAA9_9GAMM|nr:hypothetical protein B5D82_14190 [Cognaticolwellia beringensis]